MPVRMLAPAIGRVSEPYGWSCYIASRAVVTYIGPQAAKFRLAIAGRQYRNGCVVGVQLVAAHHVFPQRFV
jgi:hypothetical protein